MKKIESPLMLTLKGVIINQIPTINEFTAFIIFKSVIIYKPINTIITIQMITIQLISGPFKLSILIIKFTLIGTKK